MHYLVLISPWNSSARNYLLSCTSSGCLLQLCKVSSVSVHLLIEELRLRDISVHSLTRVLTHSLTRVLKSSLNLTLTYLPRYSLMLSLIRVPSHSQTRVLTQSHIHVLAQLLTYSLARKHNTHSTALFLLPFTHNCNPTNRIHIFIYRTHSQQCTHNTSIHSNIVWRSTSKVYNCIMHPFSN